MGVSYATRSDVMGTGVPRGALVRPSREIARADVPSSSLEVEGHGLADDDVLSFQVDAAGVLPTPLALGVTYYAKVVDEDHFQVAAAAGGIAIVLATAGTAPFALVVPIGPMIDKYTEIYSRWADRKCIAHVVPFVDPYPTEVVNIVALRTVLKVLGVLGRTIPNLEKQLVDEMADFLTFASTPLRDARATSPANTAVARSAEAAVASSRGTIP